jgi:hypothetical protein
MAALLTTLTALVALVDPAYAATSHQYATTNSSVSLAELALGKVLADAAPAFGDYVDVQSNTSTW